MSSCSLPIQKLSSTKEDKQQNCLASRNAPSLGGKIIKWAVQLYQGKGGSGHLKALSTGLRSGHSL
eukprot:743875-Pelagomonas_calceolata.AAC.4